jgi:hypothetical protein
MTSKGVVIAPVMAPIIKLKHRVYGSDSQKKKVCGSDFVRKRKYENP